ncbi:MAG: RNA polymerase sigma factor [Nannocystales bacterium]
MDRTEAQELHTAPSDALSQIYREHAPFVWRSLRRLGVPPDALEDALQDVFVVAARRLEAFEGRSSMKTWLFGIAMRVQRSRRRSQARHDRKLGALTHETGAPPTDAYARQDAQRVLTQMLQHLSEDKRAVFVLVELEGEAVVDVARALGANSNTIYTRLRAARKALQTMARQWAETERA